VSSRACPTCSSVVPVASRYCPECGRPLAEGAAPSRAASPWWPPDPFLLVVGLVAAGGVILVAAGPWKWGLVALLAAAVALFARHGRDRLPARAARIHTGRSLSIARARAFALREAMAARSREQVEVFRARRELAELEAARSRLFHDLGRAVFDCDEKGKEVAQAAAADVTARIREKEAEIETLRAQTDERLRRAQEESRETVRFESPPEPARIPEPYPPDEITPPEPAPMPPPGEPAPGPDEPAPPAAPETRAENSAKQ